MKPFATLSASGRVAIERATISIEEFCDVVAMVSATLKHTGHALPWFDRPTRERVAAAGLALQYCAGDEALEAILAKARVMKAADELDSD